MNIHDFINKNFNQESIFFEVGSHFGTDTIKLLNTTKNIHCFEPDFRNIEVFKKFNLPVKLIEYAVSDFDGETELYLSSGNVYDSQYGPTDNNFVNSKDWSASSSIKKPKNHLLITPWVKFDSKTKVKTIRIDTYCEKNSIDKIDFIWIDAQGAELDVIKSLGDYMNNTNFIFTEYSDKELYESQATKKDIMSTLGPDWILVHDFGGDLLLKNTNFTK